MKKLETLPPSPLTFPAWSQLSPITEGLKSRAESRSEPAGRGRAARIVRCGAATASTAKKTGTRSKRKTKAKTKTKIKTKTETKTKTRAKTEAKTQAKAKTLKTLKTSKPETSSATGKKTAGATKRAGAKKAAAAKKTVAAKKTAAAKKTTPQRVVAARESEVAATGSPGNGAAAVQAIEKTQTAGRKTARKEAAAEPRRSSRLVKQLLALSPVEQEVYFETLDGDALIELFEVSYPSDLVNLLLDTKKYTCRRLFEVAVKHRKRAYLDTIALYYYKDYLTTPLPLEIAGIRGGAPVPNYYAVLGVARDATEEEIHEAARLLLKAFQPGSFPPADRRLAEERRREIEDAYNRLRGEEERREVDRILPSHHYLYPRRDQTWIGRLQRLFP